jgi:pyruvate dehydrogenase E2 component (dihydrolipoamide acetyltransferase)
MAKNVIMPALEMAQETGTVVSWLKKEGDAITKGEPLLEVETDKATVEVEAGADGVLAGILAAEGTEVPVGETIAWILAPGEEVPVEKVAAQATGRAQTRQAEPAPSTQSRTRGTRQAEAPRRGRVSPKARRLAKEHGVDLDTVQGTGPDGAITGDDVLAAAKAGPASDVPALSAVARLMAERTTESWTRAPHFFLVRELDAGALIETRESLKPEVERDQNVKLTHTDLLVALVARALARHGKMNAVWTGNGIRANPDVNVSVAMAVEDGVVGAVIPNADRTALGDIAAQRHTLTERARSSTLKPSDISGGTFTISNLGMYDIDAFSAIIVPGQTAILAVGRMTDRVVARDGKPVVRPMMALTLSSDHRVVDGAQAALFLRDVAEAIAKPREWLG